MYFLSILMWFLLYLIRTDYADFSNYSPSVTNIIDFFLQLLASTTRNIFCHLDHPPK